MSANITTDPAYNTDLKVMNALLFYCLQMIAFLKRAFTWNNYQLNNWDFTDFISDNLPCTIHCEHPRVQACPMIVINISINWSDDLTSTLYVF